MLEKTYDPAEIEARHYMKWETEGAFAARPDSNGKPYTIVIPPPNVTGSLHMGHALNNTLQDILIRFERMRGRDALWQPGTDHAGIATQMVVERQLETQGLNRRNMGRDEFIKRVWLWKEQSGGTITGQLRRLGASADWSRERFTMDEGLSRAVLKVFVDLYKQGLVYKDMRLVNWDSKLLTAISDLEVEAREVKGYLWYFRYPVEGMADRHIVVATTRPETMLGDTAIAVHPDDERFKDLIGKHAILPLVGRRIPIVADEYSDPEKGSGAVKITPAHDFNDFEVGKRHGLEVINIFDQHAKLNENVPEEYRGLERYAAREKIVAALEQLGLVEKIDAHTHSVPYGDRSGVAIEPWLTEQWYVNAKTLAQPPLEAVRNGRIKLIPKSAEKTFFQWMDNIQPWCVSRQLWWGHQIPAWYGPDDHVFVELSEEEATAAAVKHYGKPVELVRDTDVLDTWFSSALWPFSTLGWPDDTKELKRYYPTDVLVTGLDILFFWVARMMMMGMHFMGEVPFHTVYLHALVTDEKGQKMSKSKGNIIDPLDLIDKYGADALRFTLTAVAAQGRQIKLSPQRVEGYRNFATKLWNATRFCEMNGCQPVPGFDPAQCTLTLSKWLVGELAAASAKVTTALEEYRFNEAANALYDFIWGTYCDWFVELAKPVLQGGDADAKAQAEIRATAAWAIGQMLHLLHPIMPFITEELFEKFIGKSDGGKMAGLIRAAWPQLSTALQDRDAAAEIGWLIKVISDIRAVRAEMNVPAGAQLPLLVSGASEETKSRLQRYGALIERLARAASIDAAAGAMPKGAVQIVIDEATYGLPLADVIDFAAESARLKKEIGKLEAEIGKIDGKLANQAFIAKAPPEVVEEQHQRRDDAKSTRDRLTQALQRLAS
ncbi:MAG: valine--tRNA ligase [Rhodospirillales bacterium]